MEAHDHQGSVMCHEAKAPALPAVLLQLHLRIECHSMPVYPRPCHVVACFSVDLFIRYSLLPSHLCSTPMLAKDSPANHQNSNVSFVRWRCERRRRTSHIRNSKLRFAFLSLASRKTRTRRYTHSLASSPKVGTFFQQLPAPCTSCIWFCGLEAVD